MQIIKNSFRVDLDKEKKKCYLDCYLDNEKSHVFKNYNLKPSNRYKRGFHVVFK